MKFLVTLVVMVLCVPGLIAQETPEKITESALKYLITDAQVEQLFKEQTGESMFKIHVAKQEIGFNVLSLDVAVLRKYYAPQYDPFTKTTDKELKLQKFVVDSLYLVEKKFNHNFSLATNASASVDSEVNCLIYFSKINAHQLYAELVPFNAAIRSTDSYLDKQGMVISLLFMLNKTDDKILDMITGVVYVD